MKKRIFSILLCLCMVLTLFPVTAFAEGADLIISVSGFEVGKTPADCSVFIYSTMPGITFGEDDIYQLYWIVEDEDGSPSVMGGSHVFQADKRYAFELILLNKGLNAAPTVTINGKTPDYCVMNTRDGVKWSFTVRSAFDNPAVPPTIQGADVVCAQQDYAFTVTTEDDVTVTGATAGNEYAGGDVHLSDNGEGVLNGVVDKSVYPSYGDHIIVTVYAIAGGQNVRAEKTIRISPDHIFEDGVCGCGEKKQYTVEYDGGAQFPLAMASKTHGEDLTLPGETFPREGYVQTGWMDERGTFYELGGAYTLDENMTFYPVYDRILTLSVPFTTTVKLGGDTAPGETVFALEVVEANAGEESYADVTVTASVTTDGAGEYEGTMTFTGPSGQLWNMLSEGAFVKQVNAGEANWKYDDTVWGLILSGGIAQMSTDDTAEEFTVQIFPAKEEETENGVYYSMVDGADEVDEMHFTNTYTKSAEKPEGDNPGTGDHSEPMMWIVLLAVSAAGAIGAGVYRKRRKNA